MGEQYKSLNNIFNLVVSWMYQIIKSLGSHETTRTTDQFTQKKKELNPYRHFNVQSIYYIEYNMYSHNIVKDVGKFK